MPKLLASSFSRLLPAVILALAGCTAHAPYRTVLNNAGCTVPEGTEENSAITPEIAKEYELRFVVFDNQGWLHERCPSRQIGEVAVCKKNLRP